jgi:hypothetical protein
MPGEREPAPSRSDHRLIHAAIDRSLAAASFM